MSIRSGKALKRTWGLWGSIAFLVTFLGLCFSLKANAAGTGSATTTGSVTVPVATLVTCNSTPVTVPPGTQTSTLVVICALSGNPNNLAASTNSFTYPATVTNGGHSLTVTPVSAVTSPDGSITGITGDYNGFNGTLQSGTGNMWRIQSTCTINTTAVTPSGTYTGTVTYNWSTI